jgi:hypothetical protein
VASSTLSNLPPPPPTRPRPYVRAHPRAPRSQLSEAVIGYAIRDNALLLQKLFSTKYFRVTLLPDVVSTGGGGGGARARTRG